MATKKVKGKAPKESKGYDPNLKDDITDVYLDEQTQKDYTEYGRATIEDRAIVGTFDGLKPVMRRSLWAIHSLGINHKHKTVKAALLVGETMGKYHPHGDSAIFDAMVAASQLPQPLIDGSDSNWGTMTSNSGAMRYINGRLTKYADKVFFDPFYLPTMQFIPNYDGTSKEPANLPTLLPNGLLNGNFGICPGVNTRTPAFTLPSVIKLLRKVYENKCVCTPEMCMDLEWISDYGGTLINSKANKQMRKEFYKTGRGSFDWESSYTLIEELNAIRYNRFAPISVSEKGSAEKKSPLEKLLLNVQAVKGVASIDDDSDKSDPFKQAYIIRFVRTCKGADREKAIAQVHKFFCERLTYDVKVTDRFLETGEDQIQINLRPITVPQLIQEWARERVNLERRACAYWVAKYTEHIRRLDLFQLAARNLKLIAAVLEDAKLTEEQQNKKLCKALKITQDDLNIILDRTLRQLRRLEEKKLIKEVKEFQGKIKELKKRSEKPKAYLLESLDTLLKDLS